MNSVLVTIAPAIDAFTSMYCPARRAASAITSSVRLPSVAFSRPADRVARLGGHRLGGVAQQRRERHDGQDGQHEEQRVGVGRELLAGEHRRHEDQQPQQRVVADLPSTGASASRLAHASVYTNGGAHVMGPCPIERMRPCHGT